MGYAMSRLEIDSENCDGGKTNNEIGNGQRSNKSLHNLDHEISLATNLKSRPHQRLAEVIPGKRELPVSTVKMLAGREGNYSGRGRFSAADRCHMLGRYLPVNGPWLIDQMTSRAYVSQFSSDGSLFVAGFQGSHIRIYNVDRGWKVQKNILAKSLRWTVTDTSLSPDQRHLVYTSMSPIVHIVDVGSAAMESLKNITSKIHSVESSSFELQLIVILSDVNTVCFADESGHLIYSGSDDNLCKVWDRRCFIARGKPAGVLVGHLEGITFLDSRGDGRYLISNGKDQTIKLWDIRKMASNATCNAGLRNYEWDYRWMDYPPQAKDLKHPGDQSVATYSGHSVLRTLIRCYFSPTYSTGQKYIYTGSHDSCVYIYDLVTGAQVGVLKHHKSPVRDCSWHPDYPMLISSSWDGDVVKWEFPGNGEAPIPAAKKRIRRRQFY
ncbi:LEC14B protein, putative [Ricinus communis]|uniref:LEC14B protein, putative n=1 Tax=Ricinus communis TaxID=3988 RepID=B9SFK3_RICCO|nr:LEC14B protein, putative [Ricinus communis]